MSKRAVIFDMDGVIFDSERAVYNCWLELADKYHLYCAEASENYHARYDDGRLPMKPGIRELLIGLRENKCRIAIASSTRSSVVEKQIEVAGLREYFDVIVGGDMVEPDQEMEEKAKYIFEDLYGVKELLIIPNMM